MSKFFFSVYLAGVVLLTTLLIAMFDKVNNWNDYPEAIFLEHIQQEEQLKQRFEKAAQQICGENATFVQMNINEIQCVTKRGYNPKKTVGVSSNVK